MDGEIESFLKDLVRTSFLYMDKLGITAERHPHETHAPTPSPQPKNPNHPDTNIFSKLRAWNHSRKT